MSIENLITLDLDNSLNSKLIYNDNINIRVSDILKVNYKIEEHVPSEISNQLLSQLHIIANDWFWINMEREDIENHIFKSDLLYLLQIDWDNVWFSSLARLWDFVYRFWTVIKKQYQWNWLYKRLSESIVENDKKYFLRTQNLNVIKSLKKSFNNVLYWKEALDYMLNNISTKCISDFLIKHWDKKETLNNNWIFKWVYWWSMWDSSRVNYIDSNFYNWFSSEEWDSLLVVYFNN